MSHDKIFKIVKVFNNNVILAEDISINQEHIIIGKGIGFAKKPGAIVNMTPSDIEKSFTTYDSDIKKEFYMLINQLDANVMGVSEEIIAIAEEKFGRLNSHIHIALTDHIGFAIDRLKMKMDVNNPFLNEIKSLYAQEFKVGIIGAKMIEEKLNVILPDSEIGFIALHIHAARQNRSVNETVRSTSLITELVQLIEDELNITLERTELSYTRLVNHLRFAIERIQKGKTEKNSFLDKIRSELKESYYLAERIGKKIEKSLDIEIDENEISYIAIHIQRLKSMYLN
ncbi:MAG: PRD domain-containing protein [Eubacteriales bacterium]